MTKFPRCSASSDEERASRSVGLLARTLAHFAFADLIWSLIIGVRMTTPRMWFMALGLVWLGISTPAFAQQSPYRSGAAKTAAQGWISSSKCSEQAQKKFPDHDTASRAKREQALRQCLVQNKVTVGDTLAPPAR